MLQPQRTRWTTLALLCLLTASAAAKDAWPVPRGPSREPQPYRYDPAVWKTVPREFLDDAQACILYAATSHLVESDGTLETITHDITRLNSRKSIEKFGEYRQITWNPSFQTVTLNEARIHKADGSSIPVEPRNLHVRDVSTDFLTYDPDKQLVISFPSLEVGDVIEVRWTIRGKHPEHGEEFFTRYHFGDNLLPVVRDELRVRVPIAKPLKFACINGDLTPASVVGGGQRYYRWTATNIHPPPRDDDGPPREELRANILCSTFQSWDQVATWKRRLRADCWECDDAIKAVVEQVTKGLRTPEEKARALTYWVRRNIRYVAAGEVHDYRPHKPAEVLALRCGDCKDGSQLLAVMLRQAGVPVALVTIGLPDNGQIVESIPSPWGTHGILLATIDGKDHWIDTTVTLGAWDFLPKNCHDRLCYIIDDKKIWLQRTPALTAADHRFEQVTHVSIAADGSSRGVRTEVTHGLAAYNQRDRWYETPVGEQRRLATSQLQDGNSLTQLCSQSIDDASLVNFDRPLRVETIYAIPAPVGNAQRESSYTDSRVWNFLLGFKVDYDRRAALHLYAPTICEHRFLVRAPAGFEFDGVPQSRTVESKWGKFTRTARFIEGDNRQAEIAFSLRLDRARIEPADFEAFRKFQKDVQDVYRAWLTLERVWDLSHAVELEAHLQIAPEDGAAAAVLAELYLHHHQAPKARRVLQAARYYRATDKALLSLAVRAAADSDEAERLQRDLVFRSLDDPTQSIRLCAMLVDHGKHDLARPLLEGLVKNGVPAVRGLAAYQLARSSLAQGQAEQALKHIDDAEKNSVGNKQLQLSAPMLRGEALVKLARPDDAFRAYEKAHQVDPKSERPLLALLEVAAYCKDPARAGDYLRRYVVLTDNSFDSLLRAADIALRLGRLDDAAELAGRARDVRFHESTQRILGLVHLRRGEIDKAAFHLERADPTPPVLAGLIDAHIALGDLRAAERASQRGSTIDRPPDDLRTARARVQALVDRRLELLRTISVPEDARTRWMTAADFVACAEDMHRRGANPAHVERLLTSAAAEGCEVGQGLSLRALLSMDRGKLAAALADAERAIQLCATDTRAWFMRGRVRQERLADGAEADLQRAADLSQRRDAEILRCLAEAQHYGGHKNVAIVTLREAIALRPGDRSMQELLQSWEK